MLLFCSLFFLKKIFKHLFSACYYKIQPLIAAIIILIILSYTVAIAGIANLLPSLQVTQLVHWVGHKLGPQFSLELPATRGVCITWRGLVRFHIGHMCRGLPFFKAGWSLY